MSKKTELEEIVRLAKLQVQIEQKLEAATENMKSVKNQLIVISEEDLPNAMAEAGLKEFTLDDGTKINIKDDVYVSITEERKPAVHDWLRKNKFGGLIKTMVTAMFPKGEEKAATTLFKQLKKEGMDVTLDEGVHAQTMKAFVNEQLRERKSIPLELFGARPVSRAIVKLPKAERK